MVQDVVQRTLPFGSSNSVIQGFLEVVHILQFTCLSPIDEHLGSSQLGAISNSAAMNILVHNFWFAFLWDIYFWGQLLNHSGGIYSAVFDTASLFSKVVLRELLCVFSILSLYSHTKQFSNWQTPAALTILSLDNLRNSYQEVNSKFQCTLVQSGM